MSVIRPKPPEDPLGYEPAAVFAAGIVPRSAVDGLADRLDAARAEVLAGREIRAGGGSSAAGSPAPTVVDLPDRLLAAYDTERPASELFAVLRTARRIRETVDRVIAVGDAGACAGIRTLFEACCHPCHNELGRGDRGGRPRLSMAGCHADNDSTQALLDLVSPAAGPRGDDLLDRWAVIAVGGSGSEETAAATRLFLAALLDGVAGDVPRLAQRVVTVAPPGDRLHDVAAAIGCPEACTIPAQVDGSRTVFTAAGLLPASIVGIDVVRLLEGAVAMNRRFREAPPAENPVLRYAAVSHLAAVGRGAACRVRATWASRLEALGAWHDRLRAEGPGRADRGVLVTQIVVGEPRRDRLTLPAFGPCAADQDGLDGMVGTTWPELLAAAVAEAREAAAREGSPPAEILLPRIDEHAVGQLLQMLMLAAAVEGRLAATGPQ
jgi:glucose-6-phosphate isomerase